MLYHSSALENASHLSAQGPAERRSGWKGLKALSERWRWYVACSTSLRLPLLGAGLV